MKHLYTVARILCLFLLGTLSWSLTTQQAQAQLGLGLVYGADTNLGAQFSLYRPFPFGAIEELGVGGDITVYVPDEVGSITLVFFELNANAHYTFYQKDELRVYALGGFNYSYISVSADGFGGLVNTGDTGLNVGGGADVGFGFARLFGEARFTLGGFDQPALAVGLRFGEGH